MAQDQQYIQYIQSHAALTSNQRRKMLSLLNETRVYSCLTINVGIHALVCLQNERIFTNILEIVRQYGGDVLTAVKNHEVIRDYLHSHCPTHPSSSLCELEHKGPCTGVFSLEKDVIGLSNILINALMSPLHSHIFSLKGSEAQICVDLLYSVREWGSSRGRAVLEEAMFKLAKRSGCWPHLLEVSDVTIVGRTPIGGGSFGDVLLGEYRGEQVALKCMRVQKGGALKMFAKELIVCSRLNHPNILPLRGGFRGVDPPMLYLISPFMERGDLQEYFMSTSPSPNTSFSILYDIAKGLQYLHTRNPPVIHGDLKPSNIFVSASVRAVIGDYGLLYIRDSHLGWSSSMGPGHGGTLRYQALELIKGEVISCSTDVYSFGCVIYWLASGGVPYSQYQFGYQVFSALFRGERLPRPETAGLSDGMWDLCTRCLATVPADRPCATECVHLLQQEGMTLPPWRPMSQEGACRSLSDNHGISSPAHSFMPRVVC